MHPLRLPGSSSNSDGFLRIKDPLSKTRLILNIVSITLGIILFITAIGLALSGVGLHAVLLSFIAISGTALIVAGLVAMHARSHLLNLFSIKDL